MSEPTNEPAPRDMAPRNPYGPATAAVRAFLVRFAGLSAADRARVVTRYVAMHSTRAWQVADVTLGETIERSGRVAERDALAGPLLQLVRPPESAETAQPSEDVDALDPIAEPALAALMALVVRDLLATPVFDTLYAPFRDEIVLAG